MDAQLHMRNWCAQTRTQCAPIDARRCLPLRWRSGRPLLSFTSLLQNHSHIPRRHARHLGLALLHRHLGASPSRRKLVVCRRPLAAPAASTAVATRRPLLVASKAGATCAAAFLSRSEVLTSQRTVASTAAGARSCREALSRRRPHHHACPITCDANCTRIT